MKLKGIINESTNPYICLALMEYYMKNVQEDELIFLVISPNTVNLGYGQNVWASCNLDEVKKAGMQISRRTAGGGVMYLEEHSFTYLLFSKKELFDEKRFRDIILKSITDLGLNPRWEGKNDMMILDSKISGIARSDSIYGYMWGGCLLVDTDLTQMMKILKVDDTRFEGKDKIKKIQSSSKSKIKKTDGTIIEYPIKKVANITDFNSSLTKQQAVDSMILNLEQSYELEMQLNNLTEEEALKLLDSSRVIRYGAKEWNYNFCPKFNFEITNMFDWGSVTLNMKVKKGVIEELAVFSDTIDSSTIDILKKLETLEFSKESITNELAKTKDNSKIVDVINWLQTIELD